MVTVILGNRVYCFGKIEFGTMECCHGNRYTGY